MTPSYSGQNNDEIYDIVNEHDQVVGQATRAEVHAKHLWHRAVHVLVFRGDGKVFLQKRSKWKDCSPQCWDSSSSGHVDSGEDYATAAVRELGEELGLVVSGPQVLQPLLRLAACIETGCEFVWVYRTESEGPFNLNPAEIESGEWFFPSEVTSLMAEKPRAFTTAFIYLWPQVLEVLSKPGNQRAG